jgi:hypothetical protein
MKNGVLILVIGQGKKCGKDFVAERVYDSLQNHYCMKYTLSTKVFETLKSLDILKDEDYKYKTENYRKYMAYLGQLYYTKNYEKVFETESKYYTIPQDINTKIIDSYMRNYYNNILPLKEEFVGNNLWCEFVNYDMRHKNYSNYPIVHIITDIRQLREYEYFKNSCIDFAKFNLFVTSNSDKVEKTGLLGNEGFYDFFMENKDYLTRIGGKTTNFEIKNNVFPCGEYDTKNLEEQIAEFVGLVNNCFDRHGWITD